MMTLMFRMIGTLFFVYNNNKGGSSMNEAFLKQVHQLEVVNNAMSLALPEFRTAAGKFTGKALEDEVQRIGELYGLVDFV